MKPVRLPAAATDGPTSVEQALHARRSVREFAAAPLSLREAAQLLWAAQGRNRPAGGRTAPSAGALYPLEVHLVAGRVEGLAPAAYRYDADAHSLSPQVAGDLRQRLAQAARAQTWLADAPAILVITAVPERTARKYGDRATRYIHMEVGHAAQNVYLQAAASGLGTVVVGAFDDAAVAALLELDPAEQPLALMPLGRPRPR